MAKIATGVIGALFAISVAAQAPMPSTDITSAEVQAFVKSLPRDAVSDKPIRVADVGGYKVGIFAVFRPKTMPGEAITHQTKITEVYQMLEGSGTLVTGGTLMDAKQDKVSNGVYTNVRGTGIEGGTSRRVAKGDIVIIPGGVPHWWSRLDGDVTYLITRADPEGKLALK
jgi:mannose-6-phosphate isomerase-like protein (cupin superfamily)